MVQQIQNVFECHLGPKQVKKWQIKSQCSLNRFTQSVSKLPLLSLNRDLPAITVLYPQNGGIRTVGLLQVSSCMNCKERQTQSTDRNSWDCCTQKGRSLCVKESPDMLTATPSVLLCSCVCVCVSFGPAQHSPKSLYEAAVFQARAGNRDHLLWTVRKEKSVWSLKRAAPGVPRHRVALSAVTPTSAPLLL